MDEALKPVFAVIRNGDLCPSWKDIQSCSEETRSLWTQFASLCIHNDSAVVVKFYLGVYLGC
jgi:hypothetical protein